MSIDLQIPYLSYLISRLLFCFNLICWLWNCLPTALSWYWWSMNIILGFTFLITIWCSWPLDYTDLVLVWSNAWWTYFLEEYCLVCYFLNASTWDLCWVTTDVGIESMSWSNIWTDFFWNLTDESIRIEIVGYLGDVCYFCDYLKDNILKSKDRK